MTEPAQAAVPAEGASEEHAGVRPDVTATPAPPPHGPQSLADLARGVLRAHVGTFQALAPRLRQSNVAGAAAEVPTSLLAPGAPGEDEVEAVHDLRVTTRRLRAAIWLFGDLLPTAAKQRRRDLRWLARRLGRVRDLDVEAGRLAAWRDEAATDARAGYDALLRALAGERGAAMGRLVSALGSDRCAALVACLLEVAAAPWAERQSADAAAVGRLVRRRYRAVRRAGDSLRAGSRAKALHRLRVESKRLRYTLESLAPAYGEPAHRLLRRLVALQDVLGDYQDARVAADHLRRIERELEGCPADAGRAAVADALAHYADLAATRRRELPEAYAAIHGRAWRRLREALDLAAVTPSRPDPAGTPASPEP